ncbi:hypothetical protein B9Z65_5297 [Elsinoe australis]|uniref:U3 small nucleolar RNA-associated protein 18 n=1 Tax=Elsinoe australis TaxID=40998 RepID=A0A2P7ZDP6_9PEZI|nr:hypothetical protein B9Z65_5297 [Elsinoe australis]
MPRRRPFTGRAEEVLAEREMEAWEKGLTLDPTTDGNLKLIRKTLSKDHSAEQAADRSRRKAKKAECKEARQHIIEQQKASRRTRAQAPERQLGSRTNNHGPSYQLLGELRAASSFQGQNDSGVMGGNTHGDKPREPHWTDVLSQEDRAKMVDFMAGERPIGFRHLIEERDVNPGFGHNLFTGITAYGPSTGHAEGKITTKPHRVAAEGWPASMKREGKTFNESEVVDFNDLTRALPRKSGSGVDFEKNASDITGSNDFLPLFHDDSPAAKNQVIRQRIEANQASVSFDPVRERERQERRQKRDQLKKDSAARQPSEQVKRANRKQRKQKQKADQKHDAPSLGLDELSTITRALNKSIQRDEKAKRRSIRKAEKQGLTLEELRALQDSRMPTKLKERKADLAEQDNAANDVITAARRRMTGGDSDDSDMEIDEGERELERMVFGDAPSFRSNLKSFGQQEKSLITTGAVEGEDDMDEDNEMGGMDDQDLFFTDTTGTGLPPSAHTNGDVSDEDETMDGTTTSRKAAWHDSDDERISVSLASVPRLRKLRVTADEDIVSGKEYIRRLRKQYVLLNPTPDWATEALTQPPQKKRRLSADSASSLSSDSDSEMPSAAPLSSLLRSSTSLTRNPISTNKTKRKLPPTVLNIQRLPDLTPTQPAAITSLTHHPTLPLLLSSNPSGTLYLHHLTPSPPAEEPNPLLTSLHLKSTSLTTSLFHPTSPRIFLSARRRYFHVWDLASGKVEKVTRGHAPNQKSMERFKLSPDGRYMALIGTGKKGGGEVNVLDAGTLQWICSVRVEGTGGVADLEWWGDGRGMVVLSQGGEVTEWDVEREEVVGRWRDEGAVGSTVVALGGRSGQVGKGARIGTDRWVVVGGKSGVVNVYDRRQWYAEWHSRKKEGKNGADEESVCPRNPKPTRTVQNLTTPVSCVVVSPDGQLVAISSRWKKDALRLVHLPSCTVYKNWPTKATPLGRITSLAFGELEGGKGEGAMGLFVGNEGGKIRAWEIRP